MQQTNNRNLIINRIMSAVLKCDNLFFKYPDAHLRYLSDEIEEENIQHGYAYGLFGSEDVINLLIDYNIWNADLESELDELPKKIEQTKLEMFRSISLPSKLNRLREELQKYKQRTEYLLYTKHSLDYLTAEGYASFVKNQFIVLNCIYDKNMNLIQEEVADSFFDMVSDKLYSVKLSEATLRDLARNEPWRTAWSIGKGNQIFNRNVCDYSDEQKMLCLWSKIYDNILEHPDCPHESVIDDDDILDGWMIEQRRKNDSKKKEVSSKNVSLNPKIQRCSEIFLMAQPHDNMSNEEIVENIRAIENLNTPDAKILKRQRLSYISKQKEEVKDIHLPGKKMELINQINEAKQHRRR